MMGSAPRRYPPKLHSEHVGFVVAVTRCDPRFVQTGG